MLPAIYYSRELDEKLLFLSRELYDLHEYMERTLMESRQIGGLENIIEKIEPCQQELKRLVDSYVDLSFHLHRMISMYDEIERMPVV